MPTLPQSKWTLPPPSFPCAATTIKQFRNKCSQNTAAMILKEYQRSWLQIECTRGHNGIQCYEGLQEACSERALPYHTVARCVKAFKEDNDDPSIILHDCDWSVELLGLESALPPPYSPSLSPCDYDLIPKWKNHFVGPASAQFMTFFRQPTAPFATSRD